MGLLKKLTKPLSKFLDKIVPNEIKPALPYLSAFAPFMLGPGAAAGSWWQKALYNPALRAGIMGGTNIASQLAQEGSEGEFSGLSALLAAGTGYGTAGGAPNQLAGWKSDMSDFAPERSFLQKARDVGITGAEKASEFLTGAGETIRDPSAWGLNKETLGAFAEPITHGTADLAMADARLALRDYENEMAGAPDAITGGVTDEGRRRAIRAAMEAGGHAEETILDALAALGLRSGGIVGLKHGGRVGLLRGGDPNDYPQQEDVSVFELQQGEGVPIGPMVQEDRQKQLLKAFAEYQAGGGTLSLKEFAAMWMRENAAGGGRINKEGGGVASVLPRGTEADYRGGGVIPVGSRERADDVPARLSKNEFVMTADAVKAAGGGSVNRGAKKMYNLMHNLEARV
jgi:hypothetical protein